MSIFGASCYIVSPPSLLGARAARMFLFPFLCFLYLSLPLLLASSHAFPLSSASPLDKDPIVAAPTATPAPTANEVGFVHFPSPSSSDLVSVQSSPTSLSLSLRQMARKAKATIAFLSTLVIYATLNSLAHTLNPSAFIWSTEDLEEKPWIASSHSWLDRNACRLLGLCGTAHVQPVQTRFGHHKVPAEAVGLADENEAEEDPSWQTAWSTRPDLSNQWDATERARRQIPGYVFEFAPLVHLFSGEQFWPCDIAEHLSHVTPTLNYTPIQSQSKHPTLQDLDQLNQWHQNGHVFLTSNDNVEDRPAWMEGAYNIPQMANSQVEESWADWDGRVDGDIPGDTEDRAQWFDSSEVGKNEAVEFDEDERVVDSGSFADALADLDDPEEVLFDDDADDSDYDDLEQELRRRFGGQRIHIEKTGGRSNAPAILMVVDKGNGIVDAFWFYFYSFNLGTVVLDVRFGNHIGDWEHCLVRFHHGKPKALFFSAHSGGEAYSYEAVEKIGRRPVIYAAKGSHAMYATPGIHSYILPWGLLHDQTDRGPLWDPLLNAHTYTYDHVNDTVRASTANPSSPTEWLYYDGHWGDKFYPLGDSRQYRFAGQYHYVNGPLGPRWKRLGRHKVCQGPDEAPCVIKNFIGESTRAKRWIRTGNE